MAVRIINMLHGMTYMLCLEVVLDSGNGAAEHHSDAATDDEHSCSLCHLVAPSNGHVYRHVCRHVGACTTHHWKALTEVVLTGTG